MIKCKVQCGCFILAFLVAPSVMALGASLVYDPLNVTQTTLAASNTLKTAESTMQTLRNTYHQLILLQQEIKNLTSGQFYNWADTQNTLNSLGSIMSQVSSISYTSQNLNTQFEKIFPGYKTSQNYNQQYQNLSNTSLNTMNGVLQTIGQSASSFSNETQRLSYLQSLEESSTGQMQAVQVAGQIAADGISQMQMLRQILISQTNAQTAYYSTQLQDQATSSADISSILANGSQVAPPIGGSGESVEFPDW